ncbi:TPA: hypothetical protein QDB04_000297 [Burkholderia vietnamiensis]|nr:hypothetical protein [Burkholderia vietnamiensis]
MAVVIYDDANGVYLGSAMGLGFWSKLDPVGQPAAVTFSDEEEENAHMATWENGRPDGVRCVQVEADQAGYASVAACMRAGLPEWLHDESPVANTLPA